MLIEAIVTPTLQNLDRDRDKRIIGFVTSAPYVLLPGVLVSCPCGCGNLMPARTQKGHLRRYLPGHYPRTNAKPIHVGVENPRCKLTPADVQAIRQARATGAKMSSLARTYNVSRQNILLIVHRRTWSHI